MADKPIVIPHRFVFVNGPKVWYRDSYLLDELAMCRQGIYDTIIDIVHQTHYDSAEGEWLPIKEI